MITVLCIVLSTVVTEYNNTHEVIMDKVDTDKVIQIKDNRRDNKIKNMITVQK